MHSEEPKSVSGLLVSPRKYASYAMLVFVILYSLLHDSWKLDTLSNLMPAVSLAIILLTFYAFSAFRATCGWEEGRKLLEIVLWQADL